MEDKNGSIEIEIFYEKLSDLEKRCLSTILKLEEDKQYLSDRTEGKMFDEIKKIIEGEIK